MLPAADNGQALPERVRAYLVGFGRGRIRAVRGGDEAHAVHSGRRLAAEKVENGRSDIDDAGSAN